MTGGRYAVQSYLEHQGRKLLARFDAGTYVALTEALSSHDVGRDRGGVEAALRGCPVPAVVGGITSDRLYPLRLQAGTGRAAARLRRARTSSTRSTATTASCWRPRRSAS